MTDKKPAQKKYAAVGNPSINAVLKSLYRFANEQQALERLQQIKDHFVTSKRTDIPEATILWVRGYAVTDTEAAQGFMGNYAAVSCQKEGDKFTLIATKLDAELRTHPQRKRPTRRHPDWGHPILRDIKKKRVFASIEEASHELQRLHEEFPEVSIPDDARLMIILYEKQEGVKSPVQKYKFEVKSIPEGGVIIEFKKNTKSAKPSVKPGAEPKKPTESQGHFTSMVILKRKRKAKPKPAA